MYNNITLPVHAKKSLVLVLLDLKAAFDMVDHAVLLPHLDHHAGICSKWFSSYLSNRSFSVMISDLSSSHFSLSCGVPQGSFLGPILFSLSFHCYANDLQIYLPLKSSGSDALHSLFNCIIDIKQHLS